MAKPGHLANAFRMNQGPQNHPHLRNGRRALPAAAILVAAILFSSQAFAGIPLSSPDFEDNFIDTAVGWNLVTYGACTATASRETNPTNVHGGGAAQKITFSGVTNGGGYLGQTFPASPGKVYKATLWVKSSTPTVIHVAFRQTYPYWFEWAGLNLSVSNAWTRFLIKGNGKQTNGQLNLMVRPEKDATLWVDDAGLADDSEHSLLTLGSTIPIPKSFFGVHVNKGGNGGLWRVPGLGHGLLRLWDSSTTWSFLEPSAGTFDWFRMDNYVEKIAGGTNLGASEIIYTLGIPPAWAASRTNDLSPYTGGYSSEPKSQTDWANYVRAVATRYNGVTRGKIKYFEVWNEVDYDLFYTGTIDEMVRLTSNTYVTLKAVDPNIKVLSPNFTVAATGYLAQFLEKGGAQWCDLISYHIYASPHSEDDMPIHQAFQNTLDYFGVTKPLWNTEGDAPLADEVVVATPSEARAASARVFLNNWLNQARNFNWYAWDIAITSNRNGLRNPLATSTDDYLTNTDGARAISNLAQWLIGGQLRSVQKFGDGLTWVANVLTKESQAGVIAWRYSGSATLSIPPQWGISSRKNLDGSGGAFSNSNILVTAEPVMLLAAANFVYTPPPSTQPLPTNSTSITSASLGLQGVIACNNPSRRGSLGIVFENVVPLTKIEILSVSGRVIHNTVASGGKNVTQVTWDLRDSQNIPVTPGVYHARLSLDNAQIGPNKRTLAIMVLP